MTPQALGQLISQTPAKARRRMIALAGPPGSGKSTVAADLVASRPGWSVLPMDGFHLDNALLDQRALRHRKGAPETFDAAGLRHLIQRVAAGETVFAPLFDRARDVSLNAAAMIGADIDTVIVEGNYLLLDHPEWAALHPFWDMAVMLQAPRDVLQARLLRRWVDLGHAPDQAQAKLEQNDMRNVDRVLANSVPADVTIPCA